MLSLHLRLFILPPSGLRNAACLTARAQRLEVYTRFAHSEETACGSKVKKGEGGGTYTPFLSPQMATWRRSP